MLGNIFTILKPKDFVPMHVLMKPVNVLFIQTNSLLNFNLEQLNHRMHYSVFIKKMFKDLKEVTVCLPF